MLVSSGRLPRDPIFEVKWDGFRLCVGLDEQGIRIATRSGRLVQDSLPELALLAESGYRMVLDGELVAGDGSPSTFYALASRLNATRPQAVARAARSTPVTLVIFDLLWLNGTPLLDRPYRARREMLEGLRLQGPSWATPAAYEDGDGLLQACADLGAEGAVAKAGDGRYLPGTRSAGWVKRKCDHWYRDHAPRRRPQRSTAPAS